MTHLDFRGFPDFRGQFTPILVGSLREVALSASHPVGAAGTDPAVALAGGSSRSSPTAAPSERDAGSPPKSPLHPVRSLPSRGPVAGWGWLG